MNAKAVDATSAQVKQQRLLVEALEHVATLCRHADGSTLEGMSLDAVKMRLVAAVQCLTDLPAEVREQVVPASDWPAVRSTRNRIVHGYVDVDDDIIRTVVRRELPGWQVTLAELVEAQADPLRRHDAHGVDTPLAHPPRPLS